ncbi:MAG TPA: TolC family protein [Bacteroidales bacterium]|jgi:outer membrane protein TolC|nr:TolC family protein [Bacteroidales bacterium]OQB63251.1 MAG: Outer membrane efflux protein [Bacteroidetes bacterium ADurb.Bin145]HOU01216.1 TolC family protein [Bacteroidales bacterium]HQG62060.1 TolC family protein [Bacteroidales bacterium]HQK67181.1 TolC family protein [Bacteroidales bacterium]
MKKSVLILLIISMPATVSLTAQKAITLKDCYEKAAEASSLAGEKDSYSSIWQLKDKNFTRGWLPSLDASGSFLYNSEVIDLSNSLGSIPIPGIADAIKPLPHEQYKFTVDINQVIYDGGTIKGARLIEKSDLQLNQKQTETELYKLRSQINQYFFNLLLLEKQEELLKNYLNLIEKRISSIQSALVNGMALKSDAEVMTSERIKLTQQLKENEIRKESLLKILNDLTGMEIDSSSELLMPQIEEDINPQLARPELEVFDLRKEQLSAGLRLIDSKKLPKVFGFATLGYGNPPGNNFFRDEFAPYYILGAGVKWNIFDWNKARDEKQIINLQKRIIDNRKDDLTDNLNRLLEGKKSEINSLKSLIGSDTELIALRKSITLSAESKYENGTITATELLNEINSEKQAVINYEIHKINLALSQVEYLNICGKDIE